MNLQDEIASELWRVVSDQYENKKYTHAVIDAIQYLFKTIKDKTGLDADGNRLITDAFLKNDDPIMRINEYQTETEKTEQRGHADLLKGIYSGFRSPRAHEIEK